MYPLGRMRVATIRDYVITCRAFEQGSMWGCAYKILKTDPTSHLTADFLDEFICDDTFKSRAEAEDFALREAIAAVARVAK
jgi:hypothetical protein